MDLIDRFGDFADQCLVFSDEIARTDETLYASTAHETMDFNVLLAKTIFSKWSPEIFKLLSAGRPLGFEEIRKAMGSISPQVLSKKLIQMEQQTLVAREVRTTHPPRVEYSLTAHGWRVILLVQPIVLYLRMTMDEGVRRRLARPLGEDAAESVSPSLRRGISAPRGSGSGPRG